MQIIDLAAEQTDYIEQIAAMMVEGFREHWPESWPELADAIKEVHDAFEPGRFSRVAVDENVVLGWVGAIPTYGVLVWELHPLVVRHDHQSQGIGRALVTDLEEQVRQRGGLTLTLGSDDEDNQTSLSGVDLYTDLWDKIRNIKNLNRHPFEFYQKLGFIITGVVPDANGIGRPDIIMSKRLY